MDNKEQVIISRLQIKFTLPIFFFLLALLFFGSTCLNAKPMNKGQAEKVARGWLKRNPEPMKMRLGKQIKKTEVYTDSSGEALYHVVYLKPEGFVVVPADLKNNLYSVSTLLLRF